jgi:Lysyl oxidase
MRRLLLLRVVPVVLALALAGAALALADRSNVAAAGSANLPDLEQATPSKIVITRHGPRRRPFYRLGFRSAVSNIGDGPLVIAASRPGLETDTMVADQLVELPGAPQQVIPDVGRLQYVVSPDHRHWHLLGFDRYTLRRVGRRAPAAKDRKTGFCLGDRYRVRTPAPAPEAVYTSRCGLDEPELLGIEQGISVGYGDDYGAILEGQYIPLTGVRAGRYVLIHRVNGDRQLRERDYANNAASVLIDLWWERGEPSWRLLRRCPHTARCDLRRAGR